MCGGHSETANAMNFGARVKKEFLGSGMVWVLRMSVYEVTLSRTRTGNLYL